MWLACLHWAELSLYFYIPVLFSFTRSTSYGLAFPSPLAAVHIKTLADTMAALKCCNLLKSMKEIYLMKVTNAVNHLSLCTQIHSSNMLIGSASLPNLLLDLNKQVVLIDKMSRKDVVLLRDRELWLEKNGGVHSVSSFVMEFSLLWLSALSDHVNLCHIECDNRTKHVANRLGGWRFPLQLHPQWDVWSNLHLLYFSVFQVFLVSSSACGSQLCSTWGLGKNVNQS